MDLRSFKKGDQITDLPVFLSKPSNVGYRYKSGAEDKDYFLHAFDGSCVLITNFIAEEDGWVTVC